MVLGQVLARALRFFPEHTATVCGEHKQTYAELQQRVDALAVGLKNLGVEQGDRVGILLLNYHRYVETILACFEIGAVIVPLNTRLAAEEFCFIVNDAECKVMVVDELLTPVIDSVRSRLETVKGFIAPSRDGYLDYEEMVRPSSAKPDKAKPEENDVAGLFYTSGTTGIPKGVMLTNRNIWMNAMQSIIALDIRPHEMNLHTAPMFHLADFPIVLTSVLSGGAQTFLKKFEPRAFMEIVQQEKVTAVLLVPTMINYIVNHPHVPKYDLSSLKRIFYGASPIPAELLKRAMSTIPDCAFVQGYGQTESSPLLTVLSSVDHITDAADPRSRRLTSCGRSIVGVEVEVFDENDRSVKPGEVGEIVARGPNVMLGYWKRPEETAKALRNGWLRTGDLGTIDADNFIYLVDRNKDMIVTGGENVYSTEVENAIYSHPAIKEVAVIGVPDPKWGESVKAVVALKDGHTLDANALIEHCEAKLAGYKVPKSIDFIDELPKSGTGKILKKVLRDEYWKGHERRVN